MRGLGGGHDGWGHEPQAWGIPRWHDAALERGWVSCRGLYGGPAGAARTPFFFPNASLMGQALQWARRGYGSGARKLGFWQAGAALVTGWH